jgi:hypothetical protein
MLNKKILTGLLFLSVSVAANANIIQINENFDGDTFDSNNFVHNQNVQENSTISYSNGAMVITNRGAFSTVRDDLFGTEDNPLLISATLNMYVSDIAFLSLRSDGQPNTSYNNEPNKGVLLRMHNFGSGQTDVMYNSVGDASDGTEYDFTNYYPPGGASFYNNPIQIEIEDFGSYANYSLTNLVSTQNFSFTQSGLENSTRGGHVVFSGGNVGWDNISIQQASATAVPEPAMASMLAFGLAGLVMSRRKRKTQL